MFHVKRPSAYYTVEKYRHIYKATRMHTSNTHQFQSTRVIEEATVIHVVVGDRAITVD
jgi:hypothetical protein